MSIADSIATALEADVGAGGVATLLTGGIYTFDETGRNGISERSTPSAYNATTHRLKPCAVVKERAAVQTGNVIDEDTQDIGIRQVVEIYLYDDGDTGHTAIKTVQGRIKTVLQGKGIGSRKVLYVSAVDDERDPALEDAAMIRCDYATYGVI